MPVRSSIDVRRLDHVVLKIAANAVLRAEERCQFKFVALAKCVSSVDKSIGQNGRLIADEPDPLAADDIDLVAE